MDAREREWSARRSWQLGLAMASMAASMVLAVAVTDALRLSVFAERWGARRLAVEQQNELGREGNVQ